METNHEPMCLGLLAREPLMPEIASIRVFAVLFSPVFRAWNSSIQALAPDPFSPRARCARALLQRGARAIRAAGLSGGARHRSGGACAGRARARRGRASRTQRAGP